MRPLILRGEIPNVEFDFEHVDTGSGQGSRTAGGDGSESQTQKTDDRVKAAYAALCVHEGATLEEITRAYHHMAQMYHPDKVAGLGPEFRELAEHRMKEINAAHEELKRRAAKG